MTTVYNLRATNNATFQWTRDLSAFAAVYNLAAATIRMQARTSPYAPDPAAYEWCSTNTAHGQILFDATTNLAVFVAPEADMAALAGDLVYDCRLEFSGGASAVIFGGRLAVATGVTRLASDLSGVGVSGGDTVTVDGERGTSPVPLPLSLSAAIAAAQASVAASILYVTAAPSPAVSASYVFALDTAAGSFYVRLPSGSWQEISGGSSPVVPGSLDLNPINPLTVAALH
jgi:hypothetical protein